VIALTYALHQEYVSEASGDNKACLILSEICSELSLEQDHIPVAEKDFDGSPKEASDAISLISKGDIKKLKELAQSNGEAIDALISLISKEDIRKLKELTNQSSGEVVDAIPTSLTSKNTNLPEESAGKLNVEVVNSRISLITKEDIKKLKELATRSNGEVIDALISLVSKRDIKKLNELIDQSSGEAINTISLISKEDLQSIEKSDAPPKGTSDAISPVSLDDPRNLKEIIAQPSSESSFLGGRISLIGKEDLKLATQPSSESSHLGGRISLIEKEDLKLVAQPSSESSHLGGRISLIGKEELKLATQSSGELIEPSGEDEHIVDQLAEEFERLPLDTSESKPTQNDSEPDHSSEEPLYEDPSDEDDGQGEWITPHNVALHKSQALNLLPSAASDKSKKAGKGRPAIPEKVDVGCMTTDFAMQNVLLHMGLNLVGVDGSKISAVKSWVLRCHACFK
jgi:hypothetical protein